MFRNKKMSSYLRNRGMKGKGHFFSKHLSEKKLKQKNIREEIKTMISRLFNLDISIKQHNILFKRLIISIVQLIDLV